VHIHLIRIEQASRSDKKKQVFLLHDTLDKFYPVCRFCLLPVYPIIHNHELGLRIKSKVLNARNGATGLEIKSLSIGNNFPSAMVIFYGDTRPS
jgi:hypothetical protein